MNLLVLRKELELWWMSNIIHRTFPDIINDLIKLDLIVFPLAYKYFVNKVSGYTWTYFGPQIYDFKALRVGIDQCFSTPF